MPSIPVIAVFDIGKTNKKLFLFDEQYKIVWEQSQQFEELPDEDGDPSENIAALTQWIYDSFDRLFKTPDWQIKALNFSGYGASFVHLNKEGYPATPLYNYLKPFPDQLKQQFYNDYGGENLFSLETASPVLGNLNSGLQLYYLKKLKAARYNSIFISLHLPQYLSYLFTGKHYSDITSIGCHTALWNFSKNAYHAWVLTEGIQQKLAPVFPTDLPIPMSRNGWAVPTGVGLHDSSAALIPYLTLFKEPFILLSTGTWCISLNAFNREPLTAAELQRDCLCYMEYQGRPVKAARLFAGYEHEQQTERLSAFFNKPAGYYQSVDFNPECIAHLKPDSKQLREDSLLQQSGFGARDLTTFENYEEAYHQLMVDILRQQTASTKLVLNKEPLKKIFVDGGFSKNKIYMHLLAAAFPQMEVYASSVAQASAMGAALALHPHYNKQKIPSDIISLVAYSLVEKNNF